MGNNILNSVDYKRCKESDLIGFFTIIDTDKYISKGIMKNLIETNKIDCLFLIFDRFTIYDKKMWLAFIRLLLDKNLEASYNKYISLYLRSVKRDKLNSQEINKIFKPLIFDQEPFINRFNNIRGHINIKDLPYDNAYKYSDTGKLFIDHIYSILSDDDYNISNLKFLFMKTGEIDYDRLFRLVKTNKINFNDIFLNFNTDSLTFDCNKIIVFFRDLSNEEYLWKGGVIFETLLNNIDTIKGAKIDELIKLLAFIIKKILKNINEEPIPVIKLRKENLFKTSFMRILSNLFLSNQSIIKLGSLPFKKINTIFEKINEIKDRLPTLEEQTVYENKFIDLIAVKTKFKEFFKNHHISPRLLGLMKAPIVVQVERLMNNIRVTWFDLTDFEGKYLKYKNKYLLLKNSLYMKKIENFIVR
jgi:hypothetical protein